MASAPMSSVTINSTWFTNYATANPSAPGAPYNLTGPNLEYVLAQDVMVSGSLGGHDVFNLPAFGSNVELNLNGFNCYVAGARVLQLTDSDLYRSTETTRAKHGYPRGFGDSAIQTQAGTSIVNQKTVM
jgi:hypothetical protein